MHGQIEKKQEHFQLSKCFPKEGVCFRLMNQVVVLQKAAEIIAFKQILSLNIYIHRLIP